MARATIVLTGAALLSAIASGAVARITQEQAATLDSSHFSVNTSDVVDGAAAVTLTDAGKAAATPPTPAAGGFAIDSDVAMPTGARRGRQAEAVYPLDKLEVGQSFHVPKTAANPDPAIRLSSTVSGWRVKYSPVVIGEDGKPVQETYEVKSYQRGPDGKGYAKGADGKRIETGSETKTRDKRGEPTRDFRVVAVSATDPRGEGARVFRIK